MKNSARCSVDIDKLILRYTWKSKQERTAKTILKKISQRQDSPHHVVSRIAWYRHKDEHTGQWATRVQKEPSKFGQLIMYNWQHQWRKERYFFKLPEILDISIQTLTYTSHFIQNLTHNRSHA